MSVSFLLRLSQGWRLLSAPLSSLRVGRSLPLAGCVRSWWKHLHLQPSVSPSSRLHPQVTDVFQHQFPVIPVNLYSFLLLSDPFLLFCPRSGWSLLALWGVQPAADLCCSGPAALQRSVSPPESETTPGWRDGTTDSRYVHTVQTLKLCVFSSSSNSIAPLICFSFLQ